MSRWRVERVALGSAVLLLHIALLWAWRSGPLVARNAERDQVPLRVRLLSVAPPAAAAPSPQPKVQRTVERRPMPARPPTPPVPDTAPTISLSLPPERSASAPIERTLDTSLPAAFARPTERSLKDRLLNDPRSNSARATVERRVADAAGSVDIVEERLDATRMRVKQRGGCVEVHVTRNAQIDPFNQSHLPTPKLVKPSC